MQLAGLIFTFNLLMKAKVFKFVHLDGPMAAADRRLQKVIYASEVKFGLKKIAVLKTTVIGV